ncbi:MAG: hypothetical protein KKA81_11370 [Bacteroidetes bacterium]|nr:hypothetical protein [Bacteroidota bacterium]
MKYLGVKIILTVVIIVLAYLVVDSVITPIQFNKIKDQREKQVIEKLKDIRSSQMIYRNINNVYTASFDTLIEFLRTGEIPVVKMIADPTDTTFTKTIKDTIGYISVGDSLFGKRPGYVLDSIKYIPYSGGKLFNMDAGKIESGGITVNVFEVTALYSDFLKGLDEQLIRNLIKSKEDIDKYPGMKVGSMLEASTDGNWE